MTIRVGLNSGEIVVCAIGNDLHVDYTVVGQTANLAARLEQMAKPGSVLTTSATFQLAEGYIAMKSLGPVPVKGLAGPVEIYEVTGVGAARTRLQVAAGTWFDAIRRPRHRAGATSPRAAACRQGRGQVVAIVGEAGVGKSRLVREFIHSQDTANWLVLESNSVSYGHAAPYLPVIELLRDYFKINVHRQTQSIRERVTGRIFALDSSLQDAIPPILDLLDSLDDTSSVPVSRPHPASAVHLSGSRPPVVARKPRAADHRCVRGPSLERLALPRSVERGGRSRTGCSLAPGGQLPSRIQGRMEEPVELSSIASGSLASEGLAKFLQALLGSDPSLPTLKSFLAERASGNPFFVEEIVRTLVDTAVLEGNAAATDLQGRSPAPRSRPRCRRSSLRVSTRCPPPISTCWRRRP